MIFRRFLSVILTLALLLSISAPAYAAADEEYLYDLRIVYGEDLADAQKKLAASEYADYTLYPYNLNEGTEAYIGFIGLGEEPHVYIAYKTTTDVELAITDIAVMDMNGGYREGNLQAALERSMEEYESFAAYYIQAFDYFRQAYVDGDRLADAAYRQLNLYIDPDSGERLGDLLLNDISTEALAMILLQGNTNILNNMRALVAMGSAAFGSELSYLERVEATAAQMDADSAAFANENWYELAVKISCSFGGLRDMVHEYEAVEESLDYTDEEFTTEEIDYLEHANVTKLLRETSYLGGKSLADYICDYQETDDSYLTIYPLIAAMNGGQKALSELFQFYNVLRYSTSALAADAMEAQIAELEELYADGINIYLDVDRDLYSGTLAVTNAADRAAASAGRSVASDIFGRDNAIITYVISGVALTGNIGLLVYNLSAIKAHAKQLATEAANKYNETIGLNNVLIKVDGQSKWVNCQDGMLYLAQKHNIHIDQTLPLKQQLAEFTQNAGAPSNFAADTYDQLAALQIRSTTANANTASNNILGATKGYTSKTGLSTAGVWTVFGGIMLAIAAVNGSIWIHNYYNPELTDIPLALVDVLSTDDGDRYLYYDVVKSIDGKAADTNAFEGEAWNALYFTRSYEAGPALLADFEISYDSSVAPKNCISVHKFGDTVGFDLNKHAFGDELQIYLSVARSNDLKSGATDIPDVVGTVLSIGSYFLAAGLGIAAGIGIMIGVQRSKKKEAQEA